MLPRGDAKLIQIVDAAFADAARRAGPHLVCRLGCTQCCHGIFPINQLDAARLRLGIKRLGRIDPELALRIRQRAQQSVDRLRNEFPGDMTTGILSEDESAEPAFEHFADDEPCPALDPSSGACNLYAYRPMTCRVFGPPVRSEGGLGICELCFQNATDEEIAACEMDPDPDDLESKLVANVEQLSDVRGNTIVGFALL
jgi:Fe-S-cluster containining protein